MLQVSGLITKSAV